MLLIFTLKVPAPVLGSPFQVLSKPSTEKVWPCAVMVILPLLILRAKDEVASSCSAGVGLSPSCADVPAFGARLRNGRGEGAVRAVHLQR